MDTAANWRNDITQIPKPTLSDHIQVISTNGKYGRNPYIAFAMTSIIVLFLMILLRPPMCVWQSTQDTPKKLQWNDVLWAFIAGA